METLVVAAAAALIAFIVGYVKGYKRGSQALARHIKKLMM